MSLEAIQTNKATITYSEDSKGFPSFYSYRAEFLKGMNQYLYSFKQGNLWRHNTNELRNNYYGVNYASSITSVFNQQPLQNKIFKTLNLESDDPWGAKLFTDIQLDGEISVNYFVKKEGSWFGFVRSDGPTGPDTNDTQWELRSVNGLGVSSLIQSFDPVNVIVSFPTNISIGSIITAGDYMYYAAGPNYDTPQFVGVLTQTFVDLPIGDNDITINTTAAAQGGFAGAPQPTFIPAVDGYWFFIKNPTAESHGVLGHYCVFELTLNTTEASELFAVESEAMKSFP